MKLNNAEAIYSGGTQARRAMINSNEVWPGITLYVGGSRSDQDDGLELYQLKANLMLEIGGPSTDRPRAILPYNGYILIIYNEGDNSAYIKKINPFDFSVLTTSPSFRRRVYDATISGDFVYTAGQSQYSEKMNVNSMSLSSDYFVGNTSHNLNGATFGDDGYLYVCGTLMDVRKIDPSSMNQQASTTYDTSFNLEDIDFINNYIYATGNDEQGEVYKKLDTSLNKIAQYSAGGDTNRGYAVDAASDGYIYGGGENNTVYKLNSDMTLNDSYSAGTVVRDVHHGADDRLYVGGANTVVYQLNPSNMTQTNSKDYSSSGNLITSLLTTPSLGF